MTQPTLVLPPHAAASRAEFGIIGLSPPIQLLRQQIRRYAHSQHTVLIEGETGSGKELVATALHLARHDSDSFFPVNCAAIPPPLLEASLFGHTRNAFTGAHRDCRGLFEQADNGTLFLDEIAELPFELQAKLLRVLENGEFRRIGETALRHSHARILAASNRDLRHEAASGRFRSDLFHRLNILVIRVPPLRELGQDKVLLLDHFRHTLAAQNDLPTFELDPDALPYWEAYPFPGNTRELRGLVIRLLTAYPGKVVSVEQLQAELPHLRAPAEVAPNGPPEAHALMQNLDEAMTRHARQYIASALARTQGNISTAARLLGIPRSTLCSRMTALDIPRR
ncbi:sigma-54 dependent transcriptional regulator [Ferriphaselus sp. R-1]|uniref:sigma 54-interacting transcriptional regulator n=1 Tax=Ferriphaselus sp. R-1 TaxID=1485544 RepID=UPI00068BB772|nr:sigma-54 dependent transcriptional regulator [Ferriphaselus sp. R-1]